MNLMGQLVELIEDFTGVLGDVHFGVTAVEVGDAPGQSSPVPTSGLPEAFETSEPADAQLAYTAEPKIDCESTDAERMPREILIQMKCIK